MKHLLLFCIGLICSIQISAQEISQELVSSSGDCYQTDIVLFSWSLGECMVETFVNKSIMLSEGFHQALLLDSNPEENKEVEKLEIFIHPNPAQDYVQLSISEDLNPLNGSYIEIYDLSGILLLKRAILSHVEFIELSSFNKKSLIIRITKDNLVLKSMKIQRVQ